MQLGVAVLVVSHRPAALAAADRVVALAAVDAPLAPVSDPVPVAKAAVARPGSRPAPTGERQPVRHLDSLLRPVFARPTAWRVLDVLIAVVMTALGISLAVRGFTGA